MAQLNFRFGQVIVHTVFWAIGALIGALISREDLDSLLDFGHPDIADSCGYKSGFICSFDAEMNGYFTLFMGLTLFTACANFFWRELIRVRNPLGAMIYENGQISFHKSFSIDDPIPLPNFSVFGLNFSTTNKRKLTESWSINGKNDVLNLKFQTLTGKTRRYFLSANLIEGGQLALARFVEAVENEK